MLAPSAWHEPKFQTPTRKADIWHKPSPIAEGFVGEVDYEGMVEDCVRVLFCLNRFFPQFKQNKTLI